MNWYHREEERYVEYGSSFRPSRAFGVVRSLTDTIYNMNLAHLAHDVPTIFESLDDADVRTAGTTYLMYRGRHRHEVANETALARHRDLDGVPPRRLGPARALLRRPVRQPRDRAAARSSGCPGVRDQHSGCVGAYLVEHDLFDFLLLSLPDNDCALAHGRAARDRSRRSPRPTASSSGSCTPAAASTPSSRSTP